MDAMRNSEVLSLPAATLGAEEAFLRLASGGLCILDADGVILRANAVLCDMLGMKEESILGSAMDTRLSGIGLSDLLERAVPGEAWVFTARSVLGVEAFAVRAGENRIYLSVKDRTSMRELEERVALTSQIYRKISEAMAVVDENNTILMVNPAFTTITGFEAEEAVGRNFNMLRSEMDGPAFYRAIWHEIQSVGEWQGEVHHKKKSGEIRTHWLSISTLDDDKAALRRVALFSDVSRRLKAQQEMRELLRQNRQLTASILHSQEMERRHIARELHDELGQWLTAIQAEAETIVAAERRSGRSKSNAQAISEMVGNMHDSIHAIVHRLRPSLLDALGLADSLRELINEWQARYADIQCEFYMEEGLSNLDEPLNITLYRVLQEALSNVARHSKGTRVKINILRAQGDVFMLIEDDGVGMNKKANTGGVGVMGMRERVIARGGRFTLRSGKRSGVCLDIALPIVWQKA